MEVLLAGLIGACAASGLVLYFNYISQQKQLRSTTTVDVISWADDIYDRLITIHAERDATFTGAPFGLSNDEYRTVVKEAKSMLLASKMRAKVALVYGEGQELMKFDTLHDEFVNITETILKADKETWNEMNQKLGDRFSNVIEPLMKSVESMLISGARMPRLNRTLLAPPQATIYLPKREKDIELHKSGTSPAGTVKNFALWQLGKLAQAVFDAALVILVLAILVAGTWFYLGKPDIVSFIMNYPIRLDYSRQPSQEMPPLTALPEAHPAICIESPRDYGMDSTDAVAELPSGSVLRVRYSEIMLKLKMKNNRSSDMVNVVFMLGLPPDVKTSDRQWKTSWKDLETRSGRWLILNLKDDIKPGQSMDISPAIEAVFSKQGDYIIKYKFFADNLPPQNGHFIVRVAE